MSKKFLWKFPGHPDTFKTPEERTRYWKGETKKYREGVYVGTTYINGFHYFYLTQQKIRFGTDGESGYPRYRQCDQIILDGLWDDCTNGRDSIWLARREIGKSSIAGLLANYFARVFPGCRIVFTSADRSRMLELFNDKVISQWNSIHPDLRGKEINRNQTVNSAFIKIGYDVPDQYGEIELRESVIRGVETNEGPESPKKVSGGRNKFLLIDEIGLHNRRSKTIATGRETLKTNGVKTGYMLLTGTIEDDIKEESLIEIREMVADSENAQIRVHFSPFWHGIEMDDYGVSNYEVAKKKRDEEVARLEGMRDKTLLAAYRKNHPETLEEALSIGVTGGLPKEIMAMLSEQDRELNIKNIHDIRYTLACDVNGNVVAIQDSAGDFVIFEHPQKDSEYIAGIDPVPSNVKVIAEEAKIKEEDKRSKWGTIIKKRYAETYVAFYMGRSNDYERMVLRSAMLQEYFNNARGMIERNRGDAAVEKYKELKKIHLLAREPAMFHTKMSGKNPPYGVAKGGESKVDALLHECLIKYLMHHTYKIFMRAQLTQCAAYLVGNNDLLDAMQLCELYDYTLVRTAKPPVPKVEFIEIPVIVGGKYQKMRIPRRVMGEVVEKNDIVSVSG